MRLWKIIFWLIVIIILVLAVILGFTNNTKADENPGTNIDSINRYAWSDTAGWWDFHGTHTVKVNPTDLSGYASSSIGQMALNCNSTPIGDICATSDFKVTNPGAEGLLSGCAWNDTIGWISFWCGNYDCQNHSICSNSPYQVSIDGSTGSFNGFAWNDLEGWISFNGLPTYKVQTNWRSGKIIGSLESSTIDTQSTKGTTLQSIIWQGDLPNGTVVDFQIAVSNCSNGADDPPTCTNGTWVYKGPWGITSEYYGAQCPTMGPGNAGPNKSICVDLNQVANYRYLRYKIRLQSDASQIKTPRIDDIILNWSK